MLPLSSGGLRPPSSATPRSPWPVPTAAAGPWRPTAAWPGAWCAAAAAGPSAARRQGGRCAPGGAAAAALAHPGGPGPAGAGWCCWWRFPPRWPRWRQPPIAAGHHGASQPAAQAGAEGRRGAGPVL